MQKSIWSQWSRRLSSRLLGQVVKPHLIGDVPPVDASSQRHGVAELTAAQPTSEVPAAIVTVYVLQTYSRSNAILLDNETRRLGLPPALERIDAGPIHEKKAVFYLHHPSESRLYQPTTQQFPPRLQRLIDGLAQAPQLDVHLVPVTILWGRAPDKEDSWLKLLFTDSWNTPSQFKQLLNIGIHGHQTFIEFHEPQSLRKLVELAERDFPNLSTQTVVVNQLNHYLDSKREAILGPDLSDRRNVVRSVIETPDVQEAITQESLRERISIDAAQQRAFGYLNEIVSDYSYSAIRFADNTLTRLWTQLYDGVEVHNFSTVRELSDKYELIYTPCHRSHIDYLLLSYVIFRRGLMVPYIAAGDNLNLPVIGQLLRGGGAFFIRRSFKDAPLYSAVFREYLHSILMRNTPLEYFIEGGRSRTGRLLPPKTGMLAMTVQSYLRGHGKPIVFIPTYIGYERLMEGNTYVGELQGKPKEAESVIGLLKSLRKIERIFGKVHVNFGEPVFLDDMLRQHDAEGLSLASSHDPLPPPVVEAVKDTATEIMTQINRAAVINPVSLLSLVLLATPKHTLDEQTCIAQLDAYQALSRNLPYDERTEITSLSGREIISYGLKLKLIKRISHVLGDMIAIADQQAVLLTYFRNNILHLFILPSLVAALVEQNGRVARHDIHSVIQALYPFLKAELFLKWSAHELEPLIDRYIDELLATRLLLDDGRDQLFCPVPNSEQLKQLKMLAMPVKQSLERYFMILSVISRRGSGKITSKQAEDLGYLLGQRLSVLYEFDSPEFFDRALFRGFVHALDQQGYIDVDEDEQIHFGDRLQNIARNAPLVLDEDTLHMLEHLTAFTDQELRQALEQMAQQKGNKPRRKK